MSKQNKLKCTVFIDADLWQWVGDYAEETREASAGQVVRKALMEFKARVENEDKK